MDGIAFCGSEIAASTPIRHWLKGWLAQANDGLWYIAYLEAHYGDADPQRSG
jgi:hypothetical protein